MISQESRSTYLNRLERQVNNNHPRGYTIKGYHVTRAGWLKRLVTEGYTQLTDEPHKSGIGKVYTLLNPSDNTLYEFRKNVEGEYLQAIIADLA